MSYVSIQVEDVSKCYRIGLSEKRKTGSKTLAGALGSWALTPVRNFRELRNRSRFADPDAEDIIWALRNISFDVKDGEVVGIIGHNGAGKSTLLKIFSRITHPTSGRVIVQGRVSSLLEVGTGFHTELTGRENVYLNGAILGMSKKEIDQKFDEIVAFSEVEKFIDTPVKHYSSGMKVRLAFSVAAHLEPDILIIDEVLAVGDTAFQRKCLGKMEDVSGKGRTVLFVSHNLSAVRQLCGRCVLLENGRVLMDGEADRTIDSYLERTASEQKEVITDEMHRVSDGARFIQAKIHHLEGNRFGGLRNFTPLIVTFDLEILLQKIPLMAITIGFDTAEGLALTRITADLDFTARHLKTGLNRFQLEVTLPYAAGMYTMVLRADQTEPNFKPLAVVRSALVFDLHESDPSRRQVISKLKELVPLKGSWSALPAEPVDAHAEDQ